MIGVIPGPEQLPVVEEFFELFKTPWELHEPGRHYDVVIATAGDVSAVDATLLLAFGGAAMPGAPAAPGRRILRFEYDLFEEVRALLVNGQPVERAHVPALDQLIATVRDAILGAGLPLIEIPPVPAGHGFAICLTHDIDFVGIRRHGLDHSTLGFLYRSTLGGLRDLVRGRLSVGRLLRMWRAAASLPFVLAGLARDFWEPFGWYLEVEANLPATYFLIPFKNRQGEKTSGRHAAMRATKYDVTDLGEWPARLLAAGNELGVHGIDAWHSEDKARQERGRVSGATGAPVSGIRMHWLMRDAETLATLDRAGYAYDSTLGYNETVGFRNGTTQAFRPLGAAQLLELPMHIQDGALFFPDRLDLSEREAWERCAPILDHARQAGGVVTLLWHDRSHGPERFWGGFYRRLVEHLKTTTGWFATAADVAGWFRKRRAVRFDAAHGALSYDGARIEPPLTVRVHQPGAAIATRDVPWNGQSAFDCRPYLANTAAYSFQ